MKMTEQSRKPVKKLRRKTIQGFSKEDLQLRLRLLNSFNESRTQREIDQERDREWKIFDLLSSYLPTIFRRNGEMFIDDGDLNILPLNSPRDLIPILRKVSEWTPLYSAGWRNPRQARELIKELKEYHPKYFKSKK